jgi:hypothetical protein
MEQGSGISRRFRDRQLARQEPSLQGNGLAPPKGPDINAKAGTEPRHYDRCDGTPTGHGQGQFWAVQESMRIVTL